MGKMINIRDRDRLNGKEIALLQEKYFLCQLYNQEEDIDSSAKLNSTDNSANVSANSIYYRNAKNEEEIKKMPMLLIPREYFQYENCCKAFEIKKDDKTGTHTFDCGMHYTNIIRTIQKIAGGLGGRDDMARSDCIESPHLLVAKRSLFYNNYNPKKVGKRRRNRERENIKNNNCQSPYNTNKNNKKNHGSNNNFYNLKKNAKLQSK